MSNDARPAGGRQNTDNARRDEIMKILEENPSWGMGQASHEYDRRRQSQPEPAVKETADESFNRTQPTSAGSPEHVVKHDDTPSPHHHQELDAHNHANEQPVQPRHEHISDTPIRGQTTHHHHAEELSEQRVEPAPAAAPSFLPSDEQAPAQPAPEPQPAPTPPPAQPEAEKRVEVNLGAAAPRSEISPLDQNDPDRILLGAGNTLTGPMQSSEETARQVNRFFRSIPQNDNGQPLFRNEHEELTYWRIYSALSLTSPSSPNGVAAFQGALRREGVAWEQHLTTKSGRNAGWVRQDNSGTDALSALRRHRKTGNPVNQWLPASGFYLQFAAPHERDFCDFDIQFAMETAKIGMSTYGLLMSASSGVYLRHMVEFALKFVTSTSLDLMGGDMKSVLIDKIDKDDYWVVIIGMLTAKYPSGVPWTLTCMNPECDHSEDVKLNLIRATRLGNSQFTEEQRAMFERQTESEENILSQADQLAFRQAHPAVAAERFEEDGIVVTFGRSTLGDYFDVTEEWASEIADTTAAALTDYATEKDREQHMRVGAESRRLTRYLHTVKSISIHEAGEDNAKVTTETKPAEIKKLLTDLSSDRVYVAKFEEAISAYTEATRVAVFGYMGRKCPHCAKAQEGIKDGPFRGIVTISPDRLFFALSRAVSEIQKVIQLQYESIG